MISDRRANPIRLLAEIDGLIARCETTLTEFELEQDEALSVATKLQDSREMRDRVEVMLDADA